MKAQGSFINYQLSFERVKEAYSEKYIVLQNEFRKKAIAFPPKDILLVSYKAEGELQVWVKDKRKYELFKVYDVCRKSGDFGPKRKQGDKQVPEGFYKINVFNPISDFHLSLGVNYPNASDRAISSESDLGGDIYIHGDCVTVGCLPMTDELIKEIYLINALAKNEGQSDIPIYFFPFKYNKLTEYIFYKEYPEHKAFWENLREEYVYFNEKRRIRNYTIDSFGKYNFFE